MGKKAKHPVPEMTEVKASARISSHSAPEAAPSSSSPDPHKHRKCRDIPCCILFVVFWFGVFAITAMAVYYGDLNRLRYGTDFLNNTCGILNPSIGQIPAFDATNLTHVHYLGLGSLDHPIPLCVATCPKVNSTICIYGSSPSTNLVTLSQQLANGTCTITFFELEETLNRCLPADVLGTALTVTGKNSTLNKVADFLADDLNGSELAIKISHSLYTSWQIILGVSVFALAFSFIWLFLLSYLGGFMVWFTLLLANLALGGMSGFLWYNWFMLKTNGTLIFTGNKQLDSSIYNLNTMMALAIISSVVFLLVFILSIACRKRIKIAILINREASKSLRTMPFIFALPVLKYIVLIAVFAYFLYVFVLLSTSGSTIAQSTTNVLIEKVNKAPFTKVVTPNRVLPFFQIYMILAFFWTWNLVLGIWQTTIAGAVASWYWTRDKSRLPKTPLSRAFARCFRYHLGSIAFGSLIIAIFQTLRFILLYIQRQSKSVSDNSSMKYIFACLQCCLACVEKLVALINTNAYIMIAIYGYSFCEAAEKAFSLLVRNSFRLVVVEGISGFLLFLGKLLIASVSCIVSLVLLFRLQPELGNFNAVPLMFIFLISWVIASLFVAVMSMAIDTIFLCFCEDCERNDGSAQKPYFMTNSLKEFTDKHKFDKPDL